MVAPAVARPPLTCPRAADGCEFTTDDRARGRNSTMGRHIQSTHPTRRRVDWCSTCKVDGSMGPGHDASYACESGWYTHCSCDTCF